MDKPTWKGIQRIFVSLIIAFVFLIFLMTAVTQQSVSARIEKAGLDLGYSGTLALKREVEERQRGLPAQRLAQAELLEHLRVREEAEQTAIGKYNDAWDASISVIKRLAKRPECDISLDPAKPVAYGDRASLWGQARICVQEHAKDLPAPLVEDFSASHFPELRRNAVDAGAAAAKIRKQADEGAAAIAKAATPTPEEVKAIASFRDADVLSGRFTRWLVDFPPPVLQLLLAAAAGAFGALLITLILLVYPNTVFEFSTSGAFWERIMLGGFIAVCVYIVLLGGTAVLGTASFDQGGANYMTFCAISVLAGMFSDRVAHWLSKRADLFFKEDPAGKARRTAGD